MCPPVLVERDVVNEIVALRGCYLLYDGAHAALPFLVGTRAGEIRDAAIFFDEVDGQILLGNCSFIEVADLTCGEYCNLMPP